MTYLIYAREKRVALEIIAIENAEPAIFMLIANQQCIFATCPRGMGLNGFVSADIIA